MSFHVGQLVICVDGGPGENPFGRLPRRGAIYTINRVLWSEHFSREHVVVAENNIEYRADRFRPLDDTRLSIFRSLLEPKPGRVKVGVE